ncbi:hypothetical protein Q5P01_019897 [Channa striata]|uniref:Trichohyalin-plectin-homology domain-containing protein n=1 Tax=Channa striata TaxID=64152 RepID=A0AA88M3A0_CHASR|nr:hypothetical protein Q5P01_019897 [Channa striata]
MSNADWEKMQSLLKRPMAEISSWQEMVDKNAILEFLGAELSKAPRKKLCVSTNDKPQAHRANLIDMMKQERQKIIERAKFMALQQDDRVRLFNRMLQKTYAHNVNEAMIQLNEEKRRIADEQSRQYGLDVRFRQREYAKQEQDTARQKQLSNQALAADLARQVKEKQERRDKQLQQDKREGEITRRIGEFCAKEELRNRARQREQARKIHLKNLQEELSSRTLLREMEACRLRLEEEKRQRAQSDLEYKIQQRQNEQAQKFRKHQLLVENVRANLGAKLKEQAAAIAQKEEKNLLQSLAKQDALVAKQQKEEDERRAAMANAIAAYRERAIQQKKQKEQDERKSSLQWLQVQKEDDRRFSQEEALKAQRARESLLKCREANEILIAQKRARADKLEMEEYEAQLRYEQQLAERDEEIEQYIGTELLRLAAHREGLDFNVDCQEPGCSCQEVAKLAQDQVRLIKRYLDSEDLWRGSVSKEPPGLPLLMNSASLSATAETFETVHLEESSYRATVEALPRLGSVPKANQRPQRKRTNLQHGKAKPGKPHVKRRRLPSISSRLS